MALDFPASPVNDQAYRPGNGVGNWHYRAADSAWIRKSGTASPVNRLVNASMQVSQQNGVNTLGGTTSGSFYPADQWLASWAGMTGNVSVWNWQNSFVGSYINYYCDPVTTSIAAGGYLLFTQYVEGTRVADLKWGTASAIPIVARFSAYTSTNPGTYTFTLRNASGGRSFLAPFTLVADTWTDVVIVVPGDTTGTWPTTAAASFLFAICFDAGTTYGGGTLGWTSDNKLAHAGATHGAATIGEFRITDVGLYADPNNTGLAPEFEMPKIEEATTDSQRYWYKMHNLRGGPISVATTGAGRVSAVHPVPMRIVPAYGIVGTPRIYDGVAVGNLTALNNALAYVEEWQGSVTTATAAFTIGRPNMLIYDTASSYVAVSARM